MDKFNLLPTSKPILTFQVNSEPELIHILALGHEDSFMVIFESAYDVSEPPQELSKSEIKQKFGIDLDDASGAMSYECNNCGSDSLLKYGAINLTTKRMFVPLSNFECEGCSEPASVQEYDTSFADYLSQPVHHECKPTSFTSKS